MSCPTSSFCAAVDASGYVTTYNGTSWATASDVDGSHALESVSCTSSTSCVATDNDGDVLSYNGTAWSGALDIDSTRVIDGVSCATVNFCAAVDTSGYGLIYQPVTSTSEFTWDTNGGLALILSDGNVDYIYGLGTTPVEQVSLATSTATYLTYAESDSTWLTTNAAGNQTGFWGYDAFGTLAFGGATSAFGYAGQYTDAITGFSDMRARWYEPGTGEFASVDPDLAATGQPYAYAGDNPVNGGDPTGQLACDEGSGVPPFTPGLIQLAQTNSTCAMFMAAKYLWDNDLHGEIDDWATSAANQGELADAIVASTESLILSIWSLSNWNGNDGGTASGNACYVQGSARVVCPVTFSVWADDPETQGWIASSQSGDGGGLLYKWDGQVFDEQIKKSSELMVLEIFLESWLESFPPPSIRLCHRS